MRSAQPRAVSTEPSPPSEKVGGRATILPVVVTAVLVVHDGAAWLAECLDALALQTRPPDRLIIVDTGSVDDSFQIVSTHHRLREVIGVVITISAPRASTFGEAVDRAVEQLSSGLVSSVGSTAASGSTAPTKSTLSQAPARAYWLWLLHDDSAAAPDALALLSAAASRSPSVGVAGPKLTTWDDPSRLLEVGQQITRSGTRVGGPATGEPDQGQHDHRSDVLGVNTSGMLIRNEVFDSLGGFDPAFGQFRDDLDLCWRAHLAGHRVVVVPKARMREAAASTNGQRSPVLSPAAARCRDRRHGRQVALARCSPYAVPALALWIILASLGSAAALLIVKRPRRAWEVLGDIGSVLKPWRQISARRRLRGARRVRRRDLRSLFAPPRATLHHALDTIGEMTEGTVAFGTPRSTGDRAHRAQQLEPGSVSDDTGASDGQMRGSAYRMVRHPGFLAVMVGFVLGAVTWRSLLGALIPTNGLGITGGELLPVSADAAGLWHAWLDGWHGPGLGNALEAPAYLPVMAAGAWVLEHLPLVEAPASSVGVLIAWLLALAIPLSAWTAYLGARVATRAPWPRAWAALAWASLETLTTAQAGGRLGAVVAHILLPLVAAGFACAARRSASTSVTLGTAVALGVTGAFNPLLAALGAVAALALLVFGHGDTRVRAALILLVPIGLSGPWILRLWDNPLMLLTGPGLTVWEGAASAPWQLALLHPGGPGSYPALLSAPIVLAGVLAMARFGGDIRAPESRVPTSRAPTSGAMTALALLVVTGLAVGVASPHLVIGLVPDGQVGTGGPITLWAGTGLDLAALALIAAAAVSFSGTSPGLSTSASGRRHHRVAFVLVTAINGLAALAVVASAGMAGWSGLSGLSGWSGWSGVGQVLAARSPNIPAVAEDQADGPSGTRLLVMSRDADTIDYRLVGREPGKVIRDLPETGTAPDPLLSAAVGRTVDQKDAALPNAAQDALADQGVGFVAFRGAVTEPLVLTLDATAGLTRLSSNQGLILWRVLPRENAVSSSRLRLVDAGGSLLQMVAVTGDHGRTDVSIGPASSGVRTPGRRLVVAEPAPWADHARVRFAGRELAAVTGSEQPTYVLPSDGGQLSVTLPPTHQWWRWGQLGLLVVVLFVAAPAGSKQQRRTS